MALPPGVQAEMSLPESIFMFSRAFLHIKLGISVTLRGFRRVKLYTRSSKPHPSWGLTTFHSKTQSALQWRGSREDWALMPALSLIAGVTLGSQIPLGIFSLLCMKISLKPIA